MRVNQKLLMGAKQGETPTLKAAGGTISYYGGYKIHTFTESDSFVITDVGDSPDIEYLVVGGGGGAKGRTSSGETGGGGGGGVKTGTFTPVVGTKTITVGAGGTGANGSNSSISDVDTALGGGYGDYANNGNDGGCGGGGQGNGTTGQGYDGGIAFYSGAHDCGGGGGGAGQVGSNGYTTYISAWSSYLSYGGNGGNGKVSSITGVATYYGGGGGGGAFNDDPRMYWNAYGGSGGSGGGGNGGSANDQGGGASYPSNGTANTGGGGGGIGCTGPDIPASTGGSGIVIVRYLMTPVWSLAGPFGKGFGGDDTYVNEFSFFFPATSSNISIAWDSYDSDFADEIEVEVNGTKVGSAAYQYDNAWHTESAISVTSGLNSSSPNFIRFNNTSNPPNAWNWGVRNIVISEV